MRKKKSFLRPRCKIAVKNQLFLPSELSKILDGKKTLACNFEKKNINFFKSDFFLPWKKIPCRGTTYPFPRPVELEVHPPRKQWLKWEKMCIIILRI